MVKKNLATYYLILQGRLERGELTEEKFERLSNKLIEWAERVRKEEEVT